MDTQQQEAPSREHESDTVPLRMEDGSGNGRKRRLLVYTDDNFLGCAGWGCCVLVSLLQQPLRRAPVHALI